MNTYACLGLNPVTKRDPGLCSVQNVCKQTQISPADKIITTKVAYVIMGFSTSRYLIEHDNSECKAHIAFDLWLLSRLVNWLNIKNYSKWNWYFKYLRLYGSIKKRRLPSITDMELTGLLMMLMTCDRFILCESVRLINSTIDRLDYRKFDLIIIRSFDIFLVSPFVPYNFHDFGINVRLFLSL